MSISHCSVFELIDLEENGGGEEDKPGDEERKDSRSPSLGSPVSSNPDTMANSQAINLSKDRSVTIDRPSSKDSTALQGRRPSKDRSPKTSLTSKIEVKTSGLMSQMPTFPSSFVRLVPATSSDPIPNIVIPSHLFTTLVNIAAAGVLQALSSGLVPGLHMDQLGADQPGIDHSELGHSEMNHREVDSREMSDSETSHSELNHSDMDKTDPVRLDMERSTGERTSLERAGGIKQEMNLSELDIPPFLRMRNQFVCAACGIRFKSLDNLQAHQTYYCTKRTGGQHVIPVTSSANAGDTALKVSHEDNVTEPYRKRVNGSTAEKVVNSNNTNGNSNPKSRSSGNQQQVQSFQCTICGYKGHTLRGMRTHVRMHTEELQGANEEDFIDHLDRTAPAAIALSNGSKKRTASGLKRRKSNDHHDDPQQVMHLHHDDHQLTATAPSCPGFSSKSSPMETHSESEESVTHEPPHFNCFHCNYKSNYYGDIVKHMKLVHKDSPFNSILSHPFRQISTEQHESDHSSDDVTVGKNFAGSKTEVEVESKRRRREKSDPKVPARPSSESALPLVKKSPEPPSPSMIAEIVKGMKQQNGTAKTTGKELESSMKNSLKYCEDCDISFNFVNSYLAHKQFYCSANK